MYRSFDSEFRPVGPAPHDAAAGVPVLELVEEAPLPARFGRRSGRRSGLRLDTSRWVIDLAEDIGSRRWWRGMATMGSLALGALAFWPDFARLDAAPAVRLDDPAIEEFRSQAIAPLGFGGDSGRRMGPTRHLRPVPFVAEPAELRFTSVLAPGDSLTGLLIRAGVRPEDAGQASRLVGAGTARGPVAPGTQVALVLGPRPAPGEARPLHHAEFRARFDLAVAITRSGSAMTLCERPIAVDTTPLRIRGKVGDSLYRSARAAGAPPQAVQQYLQALDSHLSLEGDVLPGDSFDLVFAMKRAATGETEVGDLLYAGLDRGARPVAELLRWGRDGGFFSADSFSGTAIVQTGGDAGGLLTPVNGRITSLYGRRFHPVLGYARMHAGVDFGAAWGSPIIAAATGRVTFAGYHGGHGNYVRLDHGGGLGTGYGHMSRIAVAPGEQVSAGEVIGYVGSTGLSTGPHLHYEMYQGGRTVNPLGTRFATVTRTVDSKDLAAFRARLAQMKAVRPGGMLAAARPAPAPAPARPTQLALR